VSGVGQRVTTIASHNASFRGWAARGRGSSLALSVLGGLAGGVAGGAFVVAVTLVLKAGMNFVSRQVTWLLLTLPLVGLVLTMLVLQVFCRREDDPKAMALAKAPRARSPWNAWTTFPRGAVQADITGDVVATAGEEERFPWRLAPVRIVAIFCTVGFGQAMGTEAPAAYLGVAAGACLADRGRRWRRLIAPAALAGGAAGVAAVMGIWLVGTAYMLELGRRHDAPLSAERVIAALIGGFIGWMINVAFHLNLIRLVVPREPPDTFLHAVITVLAIGTIAGAITSLSAWAIYRAKKWNASKGTRLVLGGLAAGMTAVAITIIASPSAAVGPGGGAVTWAENTNALPTTLLAVSLLRAAATASAVAAGGCGGVFVPFLAIGDLAGRACAPGLGVGHDLAGSSGAAAGISGGYHLPFTALAMVLGVGGPRLATLTGLATVVVAYFGGAVAERLIDRVLTRLARRRESGAP
jgi:H+/Cl- antiporter ClcA